MLTEFNDLQSAVDDIESKMAAEGNDEVPDDVLPTAAQEMSSGRFYDLCISTHYCSLQLLLLCDVISLLAKYR